MHKYFICWDVDNICDTKGTLQNLQVVQVPPPACAAGTHVIVGKAMSEWNF